MILVVKDYKEWDVSSGWFSESNGGVSLVSVICFDDIFDLKIAGLSVMRLDRWGVFYNINWL